VQIGGRQETPAYLLHTLKPGHVIEGPAILIDDISTVVVEPKCTAHITAGHDIRIEVATGLLFQYFCLCMLRCHAAAGDTGELRVN
jgi:hypothetical protein